MTAFGYRLVLVITGLSAAHHVDHVARDFTGWPFDGGFNAFSASLFVYPVIAVGILLAQRGRVGPVFWMALAGAGAAFVLAVHVGPVAGDSVSEIPDQHGSAWATVASFAVLGAFVVALLTHFVYELRRRTTDTPGTRNG